MNEYPNARWMDVTTPARPIKTFMLDGFPELIHVIKTGFEDKYIVVHEDAYEMYLGETEIKTKAEVEAKFKITL